MSEALGMAAWVAIPASCLLYLVLAGSRRGGRDRTTPAYARSSVKFHGLWGMVLSLPLVVAGASTSLANADWSGQLLLGVSLTCWAIAILAMIGHRVPAPLTWLPLVVTSVTLLALPSGSDDFSTYVFWFAVYSLGGIGLAAWVLVSVNFALAVRKDVRFARSAKPDGASMAPQAVQR